MLKEAKYNYLLSKIKIGPVELPNRIVFGSHPTNFAVNNCFSRRHEAYYRERARGGAGMIVLEEMVVHPSDLPYEKALKGYDDSIVNGCRRISEAVKQFGAAVLAQLNHSGMQSDGTPAMRELWSPSAVADVVSREVPMEMEIYNISEVISGYASTAGNAVKGGLDGVEINAAQFSLIRQFISPLTNRRTDGYGGDLSSRLRFCFEILDAVRATMGKEKVLGIRLCGDELAPWGGLTIEESVEIAKRLEQSGLVDYITVSLGSLYSLHLSPATHLTEPGFSLPAAEAIKKAVDLPVFAEGRIHEPEYAQSILKYGKIDGVYMNRALICDPELPNKLACGDQPVRHCVSCNQGCHVRRNMGILLSCMLNPLAGVEHQDGIALSKPAAVPKKIIVAGGGPAGLETARTAAARGHSVTLFDAGGEAGGAMTALKHIKEFSKVLNFWKKEIDLHGVDIIAGRKCSASDILNLKPDAVVVATGSKNREPEFPVSGCRLAQAGEVLLSADNLGDAVLFWDVTGSQIMGRSVERLLEAGKKIYFVTPDLFAGADMAATMELATWNRRFMTCAAGVYTSSKIIEVNGGKALIENKFSGKRTVIEGIDAVVCCCWSLPDDELYMSLKGKIKELYRVGDCLAPRGIGAAVREGYLAGNSI